MALGGSRAKRRKHVLLIVALALFMLATGLVAGFFIAKSIGTYMLTHCHAANSVPTGPPPAAAADAISSRNASGFRPGAVKAISVRFRELPDPGTGEADALRAAPNADGVALELYRWFDDAILITEELTAAFLSRLEQQLADNQATNNQQPSVTTEEMSTIISTFIAVARDLLNYLRYHNSVALLPLLRQFSVEGTFTVTDINPDDLQREVYGLLNLTSMGHWYSTTSSFDTHSMRMEAYPTTSTSLPKQGSAELLADSTTAPGGKRLLSHAWQTKPHHRQRQLQAVNSIPTIPLQEALAEVVIPTDSPVLTLEDMLCAVKHNSPSGLDGMYLPSKAVNSTKKPIKCKPPPKLGLFRHGNVVFKPVVIPVVFHCQRFMQGDVLQPPMWKAEEGAANLIKVSNQKFKGTGIQFQLKEVRYDVQKFPYLLLASLEDWQACTGNPSQEVAGFPCLRETAEFPEVASLAEEFVVNVLVGGSQTSMFCNDTSADAICNTLYYGYTGSIGPWFATPSKTWREGLSDENWITMTWDMFSVYVENSERFWNGGAVTLAHELGHYLGLRHTHEGASPCEGDGFTKADAVPDTPTNLQTEQWASAKGLGVGLARWCADFRTGKKPQPKELLAFNSCGERMGQSPHLVDNVFNLLSYLPDACCMMLSPNQIARMQWASASFRPKMMASYYV